MKKQRKVLALAVAVILATSMILAGTSGVATAAIGLEFVPYSNLAHFDFCDTNDNASLFTHHFDYGTGAVTFPITDGPNGENTTVLRVVAGDAEGYQSRIRFRGSANLDDTSHLPQVGDIVTGYFYIRYVFANFAKHFKAAGNIKEICFCRIV